MSEFTKKLKAAQSKWQKAKERAKERSGGVDEIDDGRYLVRLMDAAVVQSKSSGRLQVQWTYRIQEGDFKGATKWDFDGLETEDNLVYLARKVGRFGYEAPDDLEEIESILKELTKSKPLARVRLKTKGDFQNVFIDKVFDQADEAEVLENAASEEPGGESPEEEPEPVDEEPVEEEPAEEEVDLSVGMRVAVEGRGEGKVIEVLEQEGKVRVKLDDNKVVRVAVDQLTAVEEVDETKEDEEEIPPKKPAKKVTRK